MCEFMLGWASSVSAGVCLGSDASSGLKREKEKDDVADESLGIAEAVDCCWPAVKPKEAPG